MSEPTLKERRAALGMTRAQIAEAAHVDKRILQLLELQAHEDAEAQSRVSRALDALESGQPLPDFEAEVKALQQDESHVALGKPEHK